MWSLNTVGFLGFYTSQFVAGVLRSMTERRGPPRTEAVLKISPTAARWMVLGWGGPARQEERPSPARVDLAQFQLLLDDRGILLPWA
jgi:hypothetical protein